MVKVPLPSEPYRTPRHVLQGPPPEAQPRPRNDCRPKINHRHQAPSCPSTSPTYSKQDGRSHLAEPLGAILSRMEWTKKPGPGGKLTPPDERIPRQRIPVWIDPDGQLRQALGSEADPEDPLFKLLPHYTVLPDPRSTTGYSVSATVTPPINPAGGTFRLAGTGYEPLEMPTDFQPGQTTPNFSGDAT